MNVGTVGQQGVHDRHGIVVPAQFGQLVQGSLAVFVLGHQATRAAYERCHALDVTGMQRVVPFRAEAERVA